MKNKKLTLCLLNGCAICITLRLQFMYLMSLTQTHTNALIAHEKHDETKHHQREDIFIEQIAPYDSPYRGPINRLSHDFSKIRLQKYKIFCICANIFLSLRDKFTTMQKNTYFLSVICWLFVGYSAAFAQTHVTISDPQNWTVSELKPYVGQTVIFDNPMYISSAYNNIYISPRRLFTPTNQVLPGTTEYRNLLTLNSNGAIRLDNYGSSYPESQIRTGVKVYNLKAEVYADHLVMRGGEWRGNLRADLEKGIPDVDLREGEPHTLLICGMNLEYYLNQQYDNSGMGPRSESQHQAQRAKISKALAKINADVYGFVEIQQGDSAIKEIANDLSANTGRNFKALLNGTSANGTYTTALFVYCPEKVKPYGVMQEVREGVRSRKYMQTFEEVETGERFIFSMNHFKAKSGSGTGADANQGDGQGSFNATRVGEANGVINKYNQMRAVLNDDDILIMGDLNAYAKEDPITTFLKNGFYDLHRSFHADSSYSYTFGGTAGYLDHAICSGSLLGQVTGMAAYNINSDEDDYYTYDKSSDRTMFRCSDHDPVLVGLRLDSTALPPDTSVAIANIGIYRGEEFFVIRHALDLEAPAYYRIFTMDGMMIEQGEIISEEQEVPRPAQKGLFVIIVYTKKETHQFKIINP